MIDTIIVRVIAALATVALALASFCQVKGCKPQLALQDLIPHQCTTRNPYPSNPYSEEQKRTKYKINGTATTAIEKSNPNRPAKSRLPYSYQEHEQGGQQRQPRDSHQLPQLPQLPGSYTADGAGWGVLIGPYTRTVRIIGDRRAVDRDVDRRPSTVGGDPRRPFSGPGL